jgi:predicted DNA-binding transcriptional regulator AlpA
MPKKPKRLLSRQQLLDKVPLSYPTILKLIEEGKLPRPRTFGSGTRPLWVEDEVDEKIDAMNRRPRS